jgi:lysyl-tRNA synthetase class 2
MPCPKRLQQRSDLLQAVRRFFLARSYVEVDTPIRQPVLIPEAEIIPVCSGDWFLQTSPELCMKRLLAEGCEKIFQICHCFRQGETGRLHQEEFTMLEWYHTGWNYLELMDECEELIAEVVGLSMASGSQPDFPHIYRTGRSIPLDSPWQRLTVDDAFQQFCGITAKSAVEQDIFDQLLVEKIEPHLGWAKPTFLYDYPAPLASLARKKSTDPGLAERFELYIGGIELANGFSELTDPDTQQKRFGKELAKIRDRGRVQKMPEKFVQALSTLPECAGIALGLDRLLMLSARKEKVGQVVSFARHRL